jgi:hypothetical protein
MRQREITLKVTLKNFDIDSNGNMINAHPLTIGKHSDCLQHSTSKPRK